MLPKLVSRTVNSCFVSFIVRTTFRHHLTSIGVATKTREQTVDKLFGSNSVAEAANEESMNDRTAEQLQFVRLNNVDAVG